MKRHALFVGINDYADNAFKNLRYSLSDAVALSGAFAARGFEVEVLSNPKADAVLGAVERKSSGLGPGDVFLFFFAGHGFTAPDGSHLLICANDRLAYLRHNRAGIPVDLLEELTNGRGCNRAFLLDACRTDVFAGVENRGAETRDLALVSLPDAKVHAGTCCVLRSCDRFCPAMEFDDLGHGVFTRAVMDMLGDDSFCATPFGEKFVAGIRSRMRGILSAHSVVGTQNPCFQTNGEAFYLFDVMAPNRDPQPPPPTTAYVSAPAFVTCPVCGKKNDPRDTFKCRECGRDNLCLRHQDEVTFLCAECTTAQRKAREAAERKAEAERKAREGAELNTATHEESQCAVNDAPTIGSFAHGKPIQVGDCSGKVIGGFKVLETIQTHAGAQGTVYKAKCVEDVHGLVPVGTLVALKVMAVQDEDKNIWCRIVKRTNDLAHLNHPNVVKYFGCFSEQGTFTNLHVVVQELLTGETLKDRLVRYPSGLDADEAVMIVESVLSGLSCISSHGIVHRDVKPGNIFVCLNVKGGVEAVKLIDFELANQTGGSTTRKTPPNNIIGSLDYMAPDFIDSKFHGDVQSDVFSVGVVFHEVLTGKMPYQHIEGDHARVIFLWTSRWTNAFSDGENPIKIHGRVKRLLAHADEVLSRALAIRREHRYGDFDEFRADLKTIRYRQLTNGQNVYRLLQFIGKGGFGEVFKARHIQTGRIVAVKHLLKPNYADRFHRQVKILKKFDDPCFVHIIDSFTLNYTGNHEFFIVMEYLPGMPGSSLRDAIKHDNGAALPFRETLLAFAHFAHGLSVLHSEGIIHRDIKPSNLYYPKGHPERVAIMGFSIARDMRGTVTSGQVPGTLDYMPPEMVLTDNRGGPGADIYALGLCLYEALTGKTAYPRLPLGAAAYSPFFERARNMSPPNLSDPIILKNSILHDLLVQMTHPDLSMRLVDAREVERRLSKLAEDQIEQQMTVDKADDKRSCTLGSEKLGECLRNARLAKGYSIEQVAKKTNLQDFVKELENGDYHRIPAPIYGRGMVRLYAECVGLDPEPLIKMFMKEFDAK